MAEEVVPERDPPEDRKGLFSRFKKSAASESSEGTLPREGNASPTDQNVHDRPDVVEIQQEPLDESRFDRLRRVFSRQKGKRVDEDVSTGKAECLDKPDQLPTLGSAREVDEVMKGGSPSDETLEKSDDNATVNLTGVFSPIEKSAEPAEITDSSQISEAAPVESLQADKTSGAAVQSVPGPTLDQQSPGEKQVKQQRLGKIKQALSRTSKGLGRVFLGKKQIDDDLLEELETHLLTADLGFDVTSEVIEALTERVQRKELDDVDALRSALRKLLVEILKPCEVPLDIEKDSPFVVMTVGVNGVGKTTTIGKLAGQYVNSGKSVMLAAGDTFRAAAVEQLQVWGERNQVPVIAQHTGADSASVIYDAFASARSRGANILIADTAGRLHTKSNLMEELKKIKRVIGKLDESAPHEIMLVLDAGTGQNAVNQLKQFHDAVGVTGIVLTKLDGTAKGGVIFAMCRRFGVPVRYIGVGEGVDDLQPFKAEDFVDALLAQDGPPVTGQESVPG